MNRSMTGALLSFIILCTPGAFADEKPVDKPAADKAEKVPEQPVSKPSTWWFSGQVGMGIRPFDRNVQREWDTQPMESPSIGVGAFRSVSIGRADLHFFYGVEASYFQTVSSQEGLTNASIETSGWMLGPVGGLSYYPETLKGFGFNTSLSYAFSQSTTTLKSAGFERDINNSSAFNSLQFTAWTFYRVSPSLKPYLRWDKSSLGGRYVRLSAGVIYEL